MRRLRRWADQDDDLRTLWAERDAMGELLPVHEIARRLRRTESAVLTRAKLLGLEYSARGGAPERNRTTRIRRLGLSCLDCGRPFMSVNKKTNRLCKACKNTGAWASGQDMTVAA